MTIEQQAREWLKSDFLADANDPEYSARMLAAFARHLSSQAPGNLSEEENDSGSATSEEQIRAMALLFFEQFKWPKGPQDQYTLVCATLRYARDHYLSGWVACSERLPEDGQEVICEAWEWNRPGTTTFRGIYTYEKATGKFFRMLGQQRDECYPPIRWMPIPPYTPQQEQPTTPTGSSPDTEHPSTSGTQDPG